MLQLRKASGVRAKLCQMAAMVRKAPSWLYHVGSGEMRSRE